MNFEIHEVREPHWLRSLVEDVVMPAVTAHALGGPIGYRYWPPDDPENYQRKWLLAVYPISGEVHGPHAGAHDGKQVTCGFTLDVGAVTRAFESVQHLNWHAPVMSDGDMTGLCLSVEGRFLTHDVVVRVLRDPPLSEPVGYRYNPENGQVTPLD